MSKSKLLIGTSVALLLSHGALSAQEVRVEELQRNFELFSGVLEEALGLEERSGLFGLAAGGVENNYLYGQGVVFEIRTPLANRRGRMSLAALNSAMQSFPGRNPFDTIQAPDPVTVQQDAMALAADGADASSVYQEMMERISSVDYSLAINTAMQQAADSMRSLRNLDGLDESDFEQIQADIAAMREEMRASLGDMRLKQEELRSASEEAKVRLLEEMEQIRESLEPLKEKAIAQASELKERTEAAREQYASQWQQDVVEFETNLYQVVCDYGSSLRELPEQENISIILTGLGEESADNRRTNKVHVFSKADVLRCQSGDIDVATLQQQSTQYSY